MQEALPVAPITKADITDELWLEIARYRAGGIPASRAPEQTPSLGDMRLPLTTLLALDGMAFVEAAYRTILARAPDDAGAAYFMREMATGGSKVVLLGQLQHSAEGRLAGRAVPGLRRRYVMHRAYRVPVLGGVARTAGVVLRRTGVSRRIAGQDRPGPATRRMSRSAILGMLGAAQEAMERRADGHQAALEAMTRHIEALQVAQERSARTLADAQAAGVANRQLLAEAQVELAKAQAAQTQMIEDATRRLSAQETASGDILAAMADMAGQNAGQVRRITAVEDSTIEALLSMSDTLADQAARLLGLECLLDGGAITARTGDGAAAPGGELDERLQRIEAIIVQNRHDLADQQRRVGLMLELLQAGNNNVSVAGLAAQTQDGHAAHADFGDARAATQERLRFYLPILAEMQVGTPEQPVLDIGCGRGEFLELLRGQGLAARGVDSDGAAVEACRATGLDCTADDALSYLTRQPPESLGAVTGFHLIEYLPFNTVARLFEEAFRVLAPGGVMIVETPNPANLLIASRWFYLDPTHRNPLPGEMLSTIAEARGFDRVSIIDLHPVEPHGTPFDRLFHGPQDYALLARKP
jgi:SAM-dependent methyltransferase